MDHRKAWREQCLDKMTAQLLGARDRYPHALRHGAVVRTVGKLSQLLVPRDVPRDEVRAILDQQLAVIEREEGVKFR